jgi:hypothetical protein
MYLPADNAQLFDILSELRLYAAMNGLPKLAEELDDALLLLETEARRPRSAPADARAALERG